MSGGPPRRVPLFPLGTVVTPGMVLPLHIFEPRYRLLVRTLMELPPDEREFGIVAIRAGSEVGGHPSLHEVGTLVQLAEVEELPDGRFNILTVGTRRFRIEGVDHSLPYTQADIELLDELPAAGELAGEKRDLRQALGEYMAQLSAMGAAQPSSPSDLPDDAAALSYLTIGMAMLDIPTRQRLLEAGTVEERLSLSVSTLRRESMMMRNWRAVPMTRLNSPRGEALN